MKLTAGLFCIIQGIAICENTIPKIAVIGGGIGGASSAYFLRQLFEENTIALHLYEPNVIGGRLATISVGGRKYEAGGAIIHPANKHMGEFLKLAGLKKRDSSTGLFGIFNGKDYPFKESSYDFVTFFRLLWRYGSDIINLRNLINEVLQNFCRIYDFQDRNYAFTSVDKLLGALSHEFPNMTRTTTTDFLKSKHFGERIIKELAEAVMNVNYGQTTDINAFVGSVSLAGAMPGLWSVFGGNHQIVENLIKHSMVRVMRQRVTEVHLLKSDNNNNHKPGAAGFEIVSEDPHTGLVSNETYHYVIVAVPLIDGVSDIIFKGFPGTIPKMHNRKYHRTVATFVQGELNLSALGLTDNDAIDEILVNNQKLFFNSIGKNYPVDFHSGEEETKKDSTNGARTSNQPSLTPIYKVFSQKSLSDAELNSLFTKIESTRVKDWLAYPNYAVPDPMDSFILYPNLFHTSPIEWAASCMEMSAISGKNAALLTYHSWRNSTSKVNPSGFFANHEEL